MVDVTSNFYVIVVIAATFNWASHAPSNGHCNTFPLTAVLWQAQTGWRHRSRQYSSFWWVAQLLLSRVAFPVVKISNTTVVSTAVILM